MNIFYISIKTSNALIRSGCSDGSALLMREMHLKITLKCYFSYPDKSTFRSAGIKVLNISKSVTSEVVNSLEFRSLLTIF
jgi:predicted Fe-Mo cluster-binding NifX family protein